MANPKVAQFYADMHTHWPYACDSVELKVEGNVASLILIFSTPASPHQLSGMGTHAIAETQDRAEDRAIEAMWKGLWNLGNGTGFPLCDNESCKVCACILGTEASVPSRPTRGRG